MKTTFVLLAALLSLWGLSGCEEDPCENRDCQNGGVCIDGRCDCPDTFTGVTCELSLDPCLSKNCVSAQTADCVSNGEVATCICEQGYEGALCSDPWTDKYPGRYEVTETCNGETQVFFANIESGPRFNQLTLVNFNNQTSAITSAKVVADLIQSSVASFRNQFMTFGKVDGSVNYTNDGEVIRLTYTIIAAPDTTSCVAEYRPR
jgi:hypothetical protein